VVRAQSATVLPGFSIELSNAVELVLGFRARAMSFTFRLLDERLAICRLPADAPLPSWPRGTFVCVTRTPDELSVVCDETSVPPGVTCVRGRRALGIAGVVEFATIGVIAGLTAPLADADVSVFVVSTHDTDWILVREDDLAAATAVLQAAGHAVIAVSRPPR
jgi:hypothetical protein